MNFKTDKRSVRTRKAIKIALLKLVKNKEISDISITELTQLAGINRNSFYTHYSSVNNILDDINQDILQETDRIMENHTYSDFSDDSYPLLSEFSRAITGNKYLTEYLLFSRTSAELNRKLKDSLCDKFYEVYLNERGDANPYVRYMLSYIVGGVFEVYYLWFKSEKDVPLESVTAKISECIRNGIAVMRAVKKS